MAKLHLVDFYGQILNLQRLVLVSNPLRNGAMLGKAIHLIIPVINAAAIFFHCVLESEEIIKATVPIVLLIVALGIFSVISRTV